MNLLIKLNLHFKKNIDFCQSFGIISNIFLYK